VPGERLSCVIMVRLPFPVPSEPVTRAGGAGTRRFRTARPAAGGPEIEAGLRSLDPAVTDRGAVVILDNRILGRDYGKAFLDVLPPASRFVGPANEIAERVGEWLDKP